MKRMQCTKCKQVFWTNLKIDEALLRGGEWIQTSCPRCGAEWAIVEPRRPMPGEGRRKAGSPPTRRPQAGPPAEEKAPVFTPARILSVRKKLPLKGT